MAAQNNDTDLAQLVRQLGQARRLTQEQLARELDVTVGTPNGWENGRHRPVRAQRARLLLMSRALGQEIDVSSASTGSPQ